MAEDTNSCARPRKTVNAICECGAQYKSAYRGGRGNTRCEACRIAIKLRADRDAARRKVLLEDPEATFLDERSVVAARKCVDCDSLAERSAAGRLLKRCLPCHAIEKRAMGHRHYVKKRDALPPRPAPAPRINPCRGCGCDVVSKPIGQPRYRCEPCRLKHRDALGAAWRAANPDTYRRMVRRNYQKRRAAKMAVDAVPYDPIEIYERDGWRCQLCRKPIKKKLKWPHPGSPSTDHLIPLADGGVDAPVNVAAAHLGCNQKKNRYGGGEQLLLIG